MRKYIIYITIISLILSCKRDDYVYKPTPFPDGNTDNEQPSITDDELLTLVQQKTFAYFWNLAESNSGAARERYHVKKPKYDNTTVAVGGTGFGLMAILVGIERGFVTKSEAIERLEKILSFLENSNRFHGAWPHWLNGNTGNVKPFSQKDNGGDLVETAFLCQGLICIKEYFKDGSTQEKSIAAKADALWKGVEWNWYTQNKNTLYWHWSPTYKFDINLQLKGYNEVLITYVLAAASPNHSIAKEVYTNGWATNGSIKSSAKAYNIPLEVNHAGNAAKGGPLFWAHYSYLGLNPTNLSDMYVNYGNATINHAKINYNYCVENPKSYKDYSENCWGLTASYTRKEDGSIGYKSHSPKNDIGVLSPTAAIASIPYTPKESIKAMRYFYKHKNKLLGTAGFYDAFSPQHNFWVAEAYLAIDQGPQIIMIENYRTGLLWKLFMQNEDVQNGLNKLGFNY